MIASQHSDVLPHAGEEASPFLTLPPLAPTRHRADGWTPERQRGFLEALASSGSVSAAARAVGMSRETAYAQRRRADARGFAQAWDAARVLAGEHLVETAWDRALHGEARQIYYHGELVGETRHYDNRLLLGLIAQNRASLSREPSPVCDAVLDDWEGALDRVVRGEALDAPPMEAEADAAQIAPPLPPETDQHGELMTEAQVLEVGLYEQWWDPALECWLTNWPAPADWEGQKYRIDVLEEAELIAPPIDPEPDERGADDDEDGSDVIGYARSLTAAEIAGLTAAAESVASARAQRLELYRRAAFGLASAAEQASLVAASGDFLARGGAG